MTLSRSRFFIGLTMGLTLASTPALAAAPGQQTTSFSPQQIATMLVQEQGDKAEIEADLKEARALLAAAKKANDSRGPDPAAPVVNLAPFEERVTTLEGQLGTVTSQITALQTAVAGKASQADLDALARWVDANTARQDDLVILAHRVGSLTERVTALEDAPVQPIVHDTVVRTSGTRAQFGVGEALTMAPPLPGSTITVMDRTEIVGRLQHAVGSVWFGAEVDAGYGFAADSTSIRALPELTVNLGDTTDFVLGAGPSYVCEGAFTGPALCSATRTGGQVQIGISQQLGPVVLDVVGGAGYDAVNSVEAGPGNVAYGFAGVRLLIGKVGTGTFVQ